jgi:uncharacterized Tic20 family protein
MPLCRECGGQFRSEARFCPHCGVSVVDDSTPHAAEPHDSSQHQFYQGGTHRPAFGTDPRTIATLCHLASFVGFVIPFGNILGPLVLWLIKRHESPYIDHHGREAVNFQITLILYLIASAILIIVLIGILLLIVVGLAGIVFTVIAAVRASEGEEYRYPMTIRLVK